MKTRLLMLSLLVTLCATGYAKKQGATKEEPQTAEKAALAKVNEYVKNLPCKYINLKSATYRV